MERELERTLGTAREHDVRWVELWFTDVEGFLGVITIGRERLEGALEGGVDLAGSDIGGLFTGSPTPGTRAWPDPDTFQLLDTGASQATAARMVCDVHPSSAEPPLEPDPRMVLKRTLERLRQRGLRPLVSPEVQYFYFRSATEPVPWDPVSHFDRAPPEAASDLRQETILALRGMGIPVPWSHYEVAPSQQEIDLPQADALTTADNVVTFRHVVKAVARSRGAHASFMPKPVAGWHGSGMHTKLSLAEGDANVFHDPGDEHGLSKMARGFMAGLLRHAPEITAVTNQWVNSYKRLVVGYDAPVYISWASRNHSALVRVPPSGGGWIEYRSPDPACNPYLALAVILAAGMRGIEDGYELPPETTANVVEMSPEERITEGILALPESLSDALEALKRSALVAGVLGRELFDHFIEKKQREWEQYKKWVLRSGERLLGPRDGVVTAFETDRYLGLL